jgi:HK97 family phage prohead protease
LSICKTVDGVGIAKIKLSSRSEVQGVIEDIRDGVIRNISVGYRLLDVEVQERKGAPELWVVHRWEPLEISAVPIPADAGSQIV